ncbi:MAG: FecR domain-containing protein [Opitutales bacterium]|nr:FecR domain-containing protein [Opitutales bacterium]
MKNLNPYDRRSKVSEKKEDAAMWYTKLERGLAEEELEGFKQAMDADETLLREIESYSNTVEAIKSLPSDTLSSLESENERLSSSILKFPHLWIGIAALLTLFVGGMYSFKRHFHFNDPSLYREHIEPRSYSFTHLLPDQSTLRIGENSTLLVKYSTEQREVTLGRGEVYFDVHPDSVRPFTVKADGFAIQAVGTAFNVDVSAQIGVVVTEGTVRLSLRRDSESMFAQVKNSQDQIVAVPLIHEGQTLLIDPDPSTKSKMIQVRESTEQEIEKAFSWRESLVDYDGSSLREIATQFEIKTGYRLVIADPELNDFVLGGIFPSDDVSGFLEVLEKGYGIPVKRTQREIILGRR